MYRIIIERSCMVNNDEWVFYSPKPIDRETVHNWADSPKLVLCREVYQQEIDAGLDTPSGMNEVFDEKVPEITSLIDAFFRVRERIQFWHNCSGSMDKAVAHEAAQYYDCMSGGVPKYVISVLVYAITSLELDLSTGVYPGKNGWNTLGDFLEDVQGVPKLDEAIIKLFPAKFLSFTPQIE